MVENRPPSFENGILGVRRLCGPTFAWLLWLKREGVSDSRLWGENQDAPFKSPAELE